MTKTARMETATKTVFDVNEKYKSEFISQVHKRLEDAQLIYDFIVDRFGQIRAGEFVNLSRRVSKAEGQAAKIGKIVAYFSNSEVKLLVANNDIKEEALIEKHDFPKMREMVDKITFMFSEHELKRIPITLFANENNDGYEFNIETFEENLNDRYTTYCENEKQEALVKLKNKIKEAIEFGEKRGVLTKTAYGPKLETLFNLKTGELTQTAHRYFSK